MEIKLNIIKSEYPALFKIKTEELDTAIFSLFDTGYNIMFPQPITIDHSNYEYLQIVNKLDSLKNNINNDTLNNKITILENSLEKLIGLSSSSAKKGELAENILENIFNSRYGDIEFKNTSQSSHSGDAWLYLPNNKIIMLESKNYTNTVNKDEVIKLQNDMIANHIKWGLFLSFNSCIQGMKEIDFHIFTHNNENYHIIFVSNLTNDISKLDFSISLIRKLINTYSDLDQFPWIINNIKSELTNLNNILEQNYLLRDQFIIMEKDIIKNMNCFYVKLRDYQFNLDNKIKDIINKITSTISDSIEFDNINYDIIINDAIKKDKKLGPIATKITDIMKKNNLYYEQKNNNFDILVNGDNIGTIKIKNKKICIEFLKYDIILNFIIGKDKEILQNLVIFQNLNL
jgi:hypothetical protein